MARISQDKITNWLQLCDNGATNVVRGQALEDLICYLFGKIPGFKVSARDHLDYAISQEIDIAIWNDRLIFLPSVILIECKNWSSPMSSSEVRDFESKLRDRGLDFGIIVALRGITGNPTERTSAHNVIAGALRDRRKMIVFTRDDIVHTISSSYIVETIKTKLTELAVNRTSFR